MPRTWDGDKNVWESAAEGDVATLQSFFSEGIDVDHRDNEDRTPLMYAAEAGQRDAVEVLLNHGADVNARDLYGFTPLMNAARVGHTSIVKLLLSRGADLNARTTLTSPSNQNAINIAAANGKDDVVQFLRQLGIEE